MSLGRTNVQRVFAFEVQPGDVLLEIMNHPDPPTVHRGDNGAITIAYKQVVEIEGGHWDEPEIGEDTPDPHPNEKIGVPVGEVIIRTVGHENGVQVHDEPCPWRVRALHVVEVCDSRALEYLWQGNARAVTLELPPAPIEEGAA